MERRFHESSGELTIVAGYGELTMKTFTRFGRRLSIPSTVQIRHELRAMSASEEIRLECAEAVGLSPQASWDEIYAERAARAAAAAG